MMARLRHRLLHSHWAGGAVIAVLFGLTQLGTALTAPVEFFDEGILHVAVLWLQTGVVPIADAYTPYGPGYGLVGAVLSGLFGSEALVLRVGNVAVLCACLLLAYGWAHRRAGPLAAVAVGLLCTGGVVARYSACIGCALLAVVLVDRVIAPDGSLTEATRQHPAALAAASAPLGLAAWVRPEWAVYSLLWGLVAWRAGGWRRAALGPAAAPLALAVLPLLWIVSSGGAAPLIRWVEYALRGYPAHRSLPIRWSAPVDVVRGLAASGPSSEPVQGGLLLLLSYGVAALLVACWAVQPLLPARRRWLVPDPSGLGPFLALCVLVLLRAQLVRSSVQQGSAIVAMIWAGVIALPLRVPRVRTIALLVAVALLAPTIAARISVVGPLRAGLASYREVSRSDPVPGYRGMPLAPRDREELRAFQALWWSRHAPGTPAFVANLRNQDAQGNNVTMYWLVRATPAAWPAVYDPGLADDPEVQREALSDLCRADAPVIRHTGTYEPTPYDRDTRSRVLDWGLALGWDDAGGTEHYRILSRNPAACPSDVALVPDSEVAARRDALARADELSPAGALALLRLERAREAGRRPEPGDAALALLGGWYVPDDALPSGAGRVAALVLRDGAAPQRDRLAAAALRDDGDVYVRALIHAAYAQALAPGAPPEERDAVLAAVARVAHDHAGLPLTLRNFAAMAPGSPELFDSLERDGAGGPWFALWRLRTAVATHDAAWAGQEVARTLAVHPADPLARGDALLAYAQLLQEQGDERCAGALRALADEIPGLDPDGAQAGGCPVALSYRRAAG